MVAFLAMAQLPDGQGKEATAKLCSQCHEIERTFSLRQDRDGWQATVSKMAMYGMRAEDDEIRMIVDYLAKSFPGEAIAKLNMNSATAIQLESGLSLKRSEAAVVVDYRAKHGKFKSLDDLKNIPGVSFAKFEAKKDRLTF